MLHAAVRPDASSVRYADPDIGDYAIIGDCRTAALISRAGSLDWLCLPHFSGPSLFAALLDQEHGGRFAIQPAQEFQSSRRYLPATPVLETTFRTGSGVVRLIDVMPIVEDAGRLAPMREVLRIVECIEGEVTLDVRFEPRPNYAREKVRIRSRSALGWSCSWSDEICLLSSNAHLEASPDGAAVIGQIHIGAGETRCFPLAYTKGDIASIAPLAEHAQDRIRRTVEWWRRWIDRCTYQGPYRAMVERSAITLKLMTFALSGAVVAAPTASLPEAIGADRNWDYRYC